MVARFLCLAAALFVGCGGSQTPAPRAGDAGEGATVGRSSRGASSPSAGAAGATEPDLAGFEVDVEADSNVVASLASACARAGCKVKREDRDGNPSLIADCHGGIFGAVHVGTTLSIRCVDMALDECNEFVLSIANAGTDANDGEGTAADDGRDGAASPPPESSGGESPLREP